MSPSITAVAQPANEPSVFRIGLEEGLSNNVVRALHQDRTGFLWIGTADGLNRFDGQDFVTYYSDRNDTTSLWSNHIRAIAEDSSGVLWVGTEAGLNSYDLVNDRWSRVVQGGDISDLAVTAGHVWIAGPNGLQLYDRTTGEVSDVRSDVSDQYRSSVDFCNGRLTYTGSGKVFVSQAYINELTAVDPFGDDDALRMTEDLKPPVAVNSSYCASDADGNEYVTVTTSGNTWQEDRTGRFQQLSNSGGRVGLVDRRGSIWAAGTNGLYVSTDGVSRPIPLANKVDRLSADVWALLEDHQGGIWVGTLGGLYRVENAANHFESVSVLKDVAVSSILVEEGETWIGSFGGGLQRISDARPRTILTHATYPQIPDNVVWAIARDGSSRVWTGTNSGLAVLEDGAEQFRNIPLPTEAVDRAVNVLVPDDRGGVFVGGGGLMHIPDGSEKVHWLTGPTTNGTLRNVQSILRDGSGRLWIGDEFNFLFRAAISEDFSSILEIDNARYLYASSDFGPASAVRDMVQTADGMLWLATDAGLIRFNPTDGGTKIFGVNEGLPSNTVSSLVEDGDRLWVATGRGVAVVVMSEESARPAVDPGRSATGEFNRRAKWVDDTGRIWLGGAGGLIGFNPDEYLKSASVPQVVITGIRKTTKRGIKKVSAEAGMRNGITLEPGEQSVGLEYVALDFVSPSVHLYAHRLATDGEWTHAGGSRSIRFSGLAPGRYEFQVAVRSGNVVHAASTASVALVVLPSFSQTWWFKALFAVTILTILYGAHRVRVARLLHVERLRSRIAGDLHDDIGSNLSSIALLSDLVSGNPDVPDAEMSRLSQISDAARQMVASLREIVWSIDPNRDRLEDLVDYLHETSTAIVDGRTLRFESTGELSVTALGLLERRAIVLMCKEVLTNAVRHSGADEIRFTIDSSAHAIRIEIADNGSGFNPATPSNGFGLRSLYQRAEAIGADVNIQSGEGAIGRGTSVHLKIPLDKYAVRRL